MTSIIEAIKTVRTQTTGDQLARYRSLLTAAITADTLPAPQTRELADLADDLNFQPHDVERHAELLREANRLKLMIAKMEGTKISGDYEATRNHQDGIAVAKRDLLALTTMNVDLYGEQRKGPRPGGTYDSAGRLISGVSIGPEDQTGYVQLASDSVGSGFHDPANVSKPSKVY